MKSIQNSLKSAIVALAVAAVLAVGMSSLVNGSVTPNTLVASSVDGGQETHG